MAELSNPVWPAHKSKNFFFFSLQSMEHDEVRACSQNKSRYCEAHYTYKGCMWVSWLYYHWLTGAQMPFPFISCECRLFFPPKKMKPTSPVALFKCVKSCFSRCRSCVRYRRADVCLRVCAHVRLRSGPNNNKRRLLQSIWASSLDSRSTWTPFTPEARGPCLYIRERGPHL